MICSIGLIDDDFEIVVCLHMCFTFITIGDKEVL